VPLDRQAGAVQHALKGINAVSAGKMLCESSQDSPHRPFAARMLR
jgi:hypothetical protein